MIRVPEAFARDTIAREGEEGRAWIATLPALVEAQCSAWGLVLDGDVPMHGYLGIVVPVKRGDELCVLKIPWRDESTEHEYLALKTWNGNGAVRLLEHQTGENFMLLERLDSQNPLLQLDLSLAVIEAGKLLRRLAVPASHLFPSLREHSLELAQNLPKLWELFARPIPKAWIEQACEVASHRGTACASSLVNYDLHYENVLWGRQGEWLAVDPKVIAGDVEYGLGQLLWCRLEEMEASGGLDRYYSSFLDSAELDPELAREWTIVRCVDYLLWGLSVGLTYDPARCRRILEYLIPL